MNNYYCAKCGKSIKKNARICPHCGSDVYAPPQIYNTYNTYVTGHQCDKWAAFFLCLLFGYFGVHKFYEGKVGMGILYIFTGGLCGIGVFVDLIVILCQSNPYYT